MLLGKRPRGPMKRTASMTGIKADLGDVEPLKPSDSPQDFLMNDQQMLGAPQEEEWNRNVVVGGPSGFDGRQMATVSPRYHKRSSGGSSGGGGGDRVIETAPFLRRCGLCNHRLRPSRDIFMYRGDTAFCSLECREQQMKHDERKEECSIAANLKKDENHHHYHPTPPATPTTAATTNATTAVSEA